jgi:hypothetical protein
MSDYYRSTNELKEAVRAALILTGNEFALQSFNRLSSMNVQLRLDPERTDYQPNPNGQVGGIIRMSNQRVDSYTLAHGAVEALAGLFSHEFSHALDHAFVLDVYNDSLFYNNRDISIYNFYKIEASAIARQFILDTDFGLNLGLQNAQLRAIYNETRAHFDAHEISWTAFEANLRAEIAAQQKAEGATAGQANKYADEVSKQAGTPTTSTGGFGTGFGFGWAVAYQAPKPGTNVTVQPTFATPPESDGAVEFLPSSESSGPVAHLNRQTAGLISAMSTFGAEAGQLDSNRTDQYTAPWRGQLFVCTV